MKKLWPFFYGDAMKNLENRENEDKFFILDAIEEDEFCQML